MYDRTLMHNVDETKPPCSKKKLPRRVLGYYKRGNIHAPNIIAFFLIRAVDLKKVLHRKKVLLMIYICDMISMQMRVYKGSNCCGKMAKKCYFPDFSIELWKK